MLVTALVAWMYGIAVALARLRVSILERERHAAWARLELEPAVKAA
jgi:heme exporter protein C